MVAADGGVFAVDGLPGISRGPHRRSAAALAPTATGTVRVLTQDGALLDV